MATYYTQASFIVPCTKEQATIAIEAFQSLTDEAWLADADNILRIVHCATTPGQPLHTLMYHYLAACFGKDEWGTPDTWDRPDWDVDVDTRGLWISHNETINTERAAYFTQAILKTFNLDAFVPLYASHGCDKPHLDGFGGHACIITKERISWRDDQRFEVAERRAHERQEQYYLLANSSNDSNTTFSAHCLVSTPRDTPLERVRRQLKSVPLITPLSDNFSLTALEPVVFNAFEHHLPHIVVT